MSGWTFFGFFFAAFIAFTVVSTIRHRRQIRLLGESRPPMSEDQFAAELFGRDVADDVSRMIYDAASFYYDGVATPYPDDRPLEPPHSIDGDDLSDICLNIWKKLALPKDEMPMRLNANTWSEIAIVLERERGRLTAYPR